MKLQSTDRAALNALQNHFSKIQIADKDGDLDRDGYTSTDWDGDGYSSGTGTIDWVADFGLPEKPKWVWLFVAVRDVASAAAYYWMAFKAKSTTTNNSAICQCERADNDGFRDYVIGVPVAEDGTTFYTITASAANTLDVYIRVNAWIR